MYALNEVKGMRLKMKLYHGSPISGLKEIKVNDSTQTGKCVYAATRHIYAVIFAAIKLMNPLITPKFIGVKKYEESNLMSDLRLIERQSGDLDRLKGKKVSIYVLDDKNFNLPREHDEMYEITSYQDAKVLEELVIEDLYEYLRKIGITMVEYKDRGKYGIPTNDDYFIVGILKTYSWKIRSGEEKEIIRANSKLDEYCEYRPDFREKLLYLKGIVDNLDDQEKDIFLENLWIKEKNDFNIDIINEYSNYILKNKKFR